MLDLFFISEPRVPSTPTKKRRVLKIKQSAESQDYQYVSSLGIFELGRPQPSTLVKILTNHERPELTRTTTQKADSPVDSPVLLR